MLTDAEVEEIMRGLAGGMRGPVLLKWVGQLLADHDERVKLARRRWEGEDGPPPARVQPGPSSE